VVFEASEAAADVRTSAGIVVGEGDGASSPF